MSIEQLHIKSCVGFNGKVTSGLKYSDCGEFAIYPLGTFIMLKSVKSGRLSFIDGHSDTVTCLSMSHDGKTLASGQKCIPGQKADIILWDLKTAIKLAKSGQEMIGDDCIITKLRPQHVGMIQDLAFSQYDDYLATLGGIDDNAVVVWDLKSNNEPEPLCGSPADNDTAYCVSWLNGRNDRFVTAGAFHVKVWQVDFRLPKIHPMSAKMGKVKRVVVSLAIEDDDHFAYAGTDTGDVLKIKIDRNEFKSYNDPDTLVPSLAGVSAERFSAGVLSIKCVVNQETGNYNILAGCGDGTIAFLNQSLKTVKERVLKLLGGVTSLSEHPKGHKIMCGTDQSNTYDISMNFSETVMTSSCHVGTINQVVFPEGTSEVCITCGVGDIRVWSTLNGSELLRIAVPTLECHACKVTPSGSAILSGWSDGKIRSFYPESGRIRFVISNAHEGKCSALGIADHDSDMKWRIISGGSEGRVRVWSITSQHQSMQASLAEHRGPVYDIKVNSDSTQAVSACADGSCIVWDLNRYVRTMAFFEANVFRAIVYHPDESQMLTCGQNHKITYWDSVDGQAIREIEGGDDFMNCLDIDPLGEFFVSGSHDKTVKIWHYDEGLPVCQGSGHSGSVNAVKISPDMKTIVSVGSQGDIIFWRMPDVGAMRDSADELVTGPEK